MEAHRPFTDLPHSDLHFLEEESPIECRNLHELLDAA